MIERHCLVDRKMNETYLRRNRVRLRRSTKRITPLDDEFTNMYKPEHWIDLRGFFTSQYCYLIVPYRSRWDMQLNHTNRCHMKIS